MKKTKILYFGLVIAIAGLLCLQAGAMTVVKTDNDLSNNEKCFILNGMKQIPFELKNLGNSMKTTDMAGNVLVSEGSDKDDYWPAITKDGAGNIAVTWTHTVSILDCDPGIAWSADDGDTWTVNQVVIDGVQKYADIAFLQGSKYDQSSGVYDGLWLSCNDELNEAANIGLIHDITDSSTWEIQSTGEQTLPAVKYCCIEDDSYYLMPNFDYTGPVEFRIDSGQGTDDEWMLYWWGADLSGYVVNWDAESILDTAPAANPDLAPVHDSDPAWTNDDFFYAVAQHNNEDTGKSEIVFKRDVPTIQADIEYVADQFYLVSGTTFDAADPEVATTGNGDKVVVVYMINDNAGGDWDIQCSYSSDQGQTWETSTVASEPQVDEGYPAIYMLGNNVYCAYIKQNNLYLVQSEDGGATWGDAEQINSVDGTVLEEENSVDIHSAGVVWTDTRNGDKDVYFAAGAAAPALTIVSISGGFGVSAEIANEGTADATNVQWSIDLEGGLVIIGKHADGTIPTLAVGATQTVKIGFVLGIGSVTITAAADGASKTASGTVLGPLVIGVS